MGALLSWGKDVSTGKLIHISEAANGLACNCVCPDPNCEGLLIARQGENNDWHFAHLGVCKSESLYQEAAGYKKEPAILRTSSHEIIQWSAEKIIAAAVLLIGAIWLLYKSFFSNKKKRRLSLHC